MKISLDSKQKSPCT